MNRVIIVILIYFSLLSCSTNKGYYKMIGETSYLNENTVQMISQSSRLFTEAFQDFSLEQEYLIGRQVAANILNNYKLQNSNDVVNYLNLICGAIVANSPMPYIFDGYHVAIIGTKNDINLFSTPGGHIFVTEGILNCINSEDELASIMAYGIATIQLQQGIKSIRTFRTTQSLMKTSMPTIISSENEIEKSHERELIIVPEIMIRDIIHNQVLEADSFAISLLLNAGYNINAYLDVISNIEKAYEDIELTYYPSFETRYKNIENIIMKSETKINDTSEFRIDRFKRIFNR